MKKVIAFAIALAALAPAQTKKVVITSAGSYYSRIGPTELAEMRAAAPGINLVMPEKEALMSELADADGIIGNINADILKAARKLKWVQVGMAGVENVLRIPGFKESPVILTNAKIVQGPEIADHAMGFLLALTRELNRAIPAKTREDWVARDYAPKELNGRTAVVLGVGGIGTQIAIRAHAHGMKVIGVDPRDMPYVPFLEKCVPPDRLDAVLPEADVLFLAAPHTEKTEKMIGAKQFGLMKNGGYFIAVSRGKLYDAAALVSALETKHLAGAGLDVTDPEPLPKGHPLWKMENVIITPHTAGRSDGEHPRYIALYKENLKRFAAGEPLLHVVDKQKGY